MENRVMLQPAYVLHKQPFQNTSLLIDFFCVDYGRVRAVAKGARREKSKYRALLQVFHPLLVSLSGRGDVKTVTAVESSVCAIHLQGERLFSGLYVNELLTKVIFANVEHSPLYKSYQDALLQLQGEEDLNKVLRHFELALLANLGYALNLEEDCVLHLPLSREYHYRFIADRGFERLARASESQELHNVFAGEQLLSLRNMSFKDHSVSNAAKRLLRLALQPHIGDKPIHSRNLFAQKQSLDLVEKQVAK
jgi:DNA repair protein RecO (recombination protein O)